MAKNNSDRTKRDLFSGLIDLIIFVLFFTWWIFMAGPSLVLSMTVANAWLNLLLLYGLPVVIGFVAVPLFGVSSLQGTIGMYLAGLKYVNNKSARPSLRDFYHRRKLWTYFIDRDWLNNREQFDEYDKQVGIFIVPRD